MRHAVQLQSRLLRADSSSKASGSCCSSPSAPMPYQMFLTTRVHWHYIHKPHINTYIYIYKPAHTHIHTNTHRHTQTDTDAQTHRRTDAQTHRHTDTQTHRHTDTQTHRHTDTQTHTHTHKHTQTQQNAHTHLCPSKAGLQRFSPRVIKQPIFGKVWANCKLRKRLSSNRSATSCHIGPSARKHWSFAPSTRSGSSV